MLIKALFGDGIIQVGLIVAILQGKSVQVPGSLSRSRNADTSIVINEANTLIGDKGVTKSTDWPKS